MINVFIADDHQVMIDGLRAVLQLQEGIDVVGEANHGLEVLAQLKDLSVDVLLLDLDMPRLDGAETCKRLAKEHPDVKPIILTMHENPGHIQSLFQLGAKGYLFKNAKTEELVRAIKEVHSGSTYLSDRAKETMIGAVTGDGSNSQESNLPRLTRRENEVLALIAEECTTQEIADRLFISYNTVESHRKNLLAKLGAKNSVGLVRSAFERGLLKP